MTNRTCLRCNSVIDERHIKEDTIEFWKCPECNKKTYKYLTKGWLGTGRFEGECLVKKEIRKESRDFRGNRSIIQRERDGWTHEVVDDEGNIIHEKHKE